MKKNVLLTLLLLLVLQIASAQMMEPVKWSFDAEKIGKEEYDIVFTADIENGWYVYSQFIETGGPIPTSFQFSAPLNLKIVGEASEAGNKKVVFDEMFGMDLVKFSDKVHFIQRIKLEDVSQPIKGHVTFMTCDDESCLPPANIHFEILLD